MTDYMTVTVPWDGPGDLDDRAPAAAAIAAVRAAAEAAARRRREKYAAARGSAKGVRASVAIVDEVATFTRAAAAVTPPAGHVTITNAT